MQILLWGEPAGCDRAPKSDGEAFVEQGVTKERQILLLGRSPLLGSIRAGSVKLV
jgi:hypothetical protein